MKLVTQTDVTFDRLGIEKGIAAFREAGFDALDFSMFDTSESSFICAPDYKEKAKALRDLAEENGLSFTQSHTPFPPFRKDNKEYSDRVMPLVERALEISGILGVDTAVVHPVACGEGQFEINIAYYQSIAPIAKEYGFKIALENMWGRNKETGKIVPNICSVSEDFNRYVDALDPRYFTALLDLGHCGLVGSNAADMLREMGSERITALHIHDNDHEHDSHTLPYMMRMDWDAILRAIADIGYKGNFTYEADNFLKGLPNALIPAALRFMAEVGRHMMAQIESYKVAE